MENLRATSIHKYPIILHGKDLLTHRLITSIRLDNRHIGSTAILSIRFHIIRTKAAVRKITSTCVTCKIFQLPLLCITPAPQFTFTGADFASTFTLKKGHTRRPVKIKGYIYVYICLTTKAIHLEPVTDLTTERRSVAGL